MCLCSVVSAVPCSVYEKSLLKYNTALKRGRKTGVLELSPYLCKDRAKPSLSSPVAGKKSAIMIFLQFQLLKEIVSSR